MNTLAANLTNPAFSPQLQALNGTTFIQKFVPAAILMGLTIGVLVFFFNLIVGGIAYINSGGDKGKAEAARSKITNALIGIVVMFAVYMTMTVVGTFFGADFLILNIDKLQIK